MIYFIQEISTLHIKIGYVSDGSEAGIESRRRQLQIGNSNILVTLGSMPGSRGDEAKIHALLRKHSVRGEWFDPAPAVLQLIALAKAAPELAAASCQFVPDNCQADRPSPAKFRRAIVGRVKRKVERHLAARMVACFIKNIAASIGEDYESVRKACNSLAECGHIVRSGSGFVHPDVVRTTGAIDSQSSQEVTE